MVETAVAQDRLNARIVLCSLTSALAGFLFGFDTVVISGAEQKIQTLWSLSPAWHGFAIASALYGTVIGSLMGCWPVDRFGRKPTLMTIGLLYFLSAVWAALSQHVGGFIAARLLGGLGIGLSTIAAPLYISEIAPPRFRGFLAGTFQFNIVLGIVIAYLSNAMLAGIGDNSWRWMIGVAAIPSLIYLLFCLFLPESPRWLLGKKGDRSRGIAVLRSIQSSASPEAIKVAADQIIAASHIGKAANRFWTRSLRTPILLAVLVAAFNQLSGINAVLYFAPRIFAMAGLSSQVALLQSLGIGIANAFFTFLGLWLIDRLGRRTLLMIGSWGYIVSLAVISCAFFSAHLSIVPVAIFTFIAAHAIGQGTVIWVLISEIFPTEHRAAGQALGSFTHWLFAATITTLFPMAASLFAPAVIFLFFCGMMVLQLIWVQTVVVETKGVPLEQIQRTLGISRD